MILKIPLSRVSAKLAMPAKRNMYTFDFILEGYNHDIRLRYPRFTLKHATVFQLNVHF